MLNKSDIELLKNQLEKRFHNYIDMIVTNSGLSRPTVSKFFNFQKVRPVNAGKIYDTGLELIQQESDQQKSRKRKANELLKGDPGEKQTTMNL